MTSKRRARKHALHLKQHYVHSVQLLVLCATGLQFYTLLHSFCSNVTGALPWMQHPSVPKTHTSVMLKNVKHFAEEP